MSNTDGFVDEVSEALRRDQLFARLKRWAPFAVLLIIGLVGYAAYSEWQRAQATGEAQLRGDALLEALSLADVAERATALAAISAEDAAPVVAMLRAEALLASEQGTAAQSLLANFPAGTGHPIWQEMAAFKALLFQIEDMPRDEARLALSAFSLAEGGLRLLAQEQLAYLDIADGDTVAAIAGLREILTQSNVPTGLSDRVTEVLLVLENSVEEPTE